MRYTSAAAFAAVRPAFERASRTCCGVGFAGFIDLFYAHRSCRQAQRATIFHEAIKNPPGCASKRGVAGCHGILWGFYRCWQARIQRAYRVLLTSHFHRDCRLPPTRKQTKQHRVFIPINFRNVRLAFFLTQTNTAGHRDFFLVDAAERLDAAHAC